MFPQYTRISHENIGNSGLIVKTILGQWNMHNQLVNMNIGVSIKQNFKTQYCQYH